MGFFGRWRESLLPLRSPSQSGLLGAQAEAVVNLTLRPLFSLLPCTQQGEDEEAQSRHLGFPSKFLTEGVKGPRTKG